MSGAPQLDRPTRAEALRRFAIIVLKAEARPDGADGHDLQWARVDH